MNRYATRQPYSPPCSSHHRLLPQMAIETAEVYSTASRSAGLPLRQISQVQQFGYTFGGKVGGGVSENLPSMGH